MSQTIISIERVDEVRQHPNADRLDIVQILGYQVVTQRGSFEVGDLAVYFPPDILLLPDLAIELGVASYLKHAIFPGATEKTQCRVSAARIRGIPSYGFCVPTKNVESRVVAGVEIGTDITELYKAVKYMPPVRLGAGEIAKELLAFHTYTDIENIQRYPNVFDDDDLVVITEKIHGTNCRLGLVRDDEGEFIFCAGSHHKRRKDDKGGLYWNFMSEEIMNLLSNLADADDLIGTVHHDVVIFGEIFGPGVQDLDYGQAEKVFYVFDISVDGRYVDYFTMEGLCKQAAIPLVPELYAGLFKGVDIEKYANGPTTFDNVRNKFKGREGCVIRPCAETYSDVLGGRQIAKSVSVDYRDRKGGQDVGE